MLLSKEKKVYCSTLFKALVLQSHNSLPALACLFSKKKIKLAVQRKRCSRIWKACIIQDAAALRGIKIIVMALKKQDKLDKSTLRKDILSLLNRISSPLTSS